MLAFSGSIAYNDYDFTKGGICYGIQNRRRLHRLLHLDGGVCVINPDMCIECGACAASCPMGVISQE